MGLNNMVSFIMISILFFCHFPILILCFTPYQCPQGVIGFGDSLSDTGNYGILFGNNSKSIMSNNSYINPIGWRAANGLTIIDLIDLAFGFSLSPPSYNRSSFNAQAFLHGANFAVASSTARETSFPYYLDVQVDQFLYWKANGYLSHELINNSLFFLFMGINDIWQSVGNENASLFDLRLTIVPKVVDSVMNAINRLYFEGARMFMVLGLPAMGCEYALEGISGTSSKYDYDSTGCFTPHNELSKLYNKKLRKRITKAQDQLENAYLIYGDIYNMHNDIIKHPTTFGFTNVGIETACCGGVGSFKHQGDACTSLNVCANPENFVSWDGLHFTEAFNSIAANLFLTGNYVEPWGTNLSQICNLDFSKFSTKSPV